MELTEILLTVGGTISVFGLALFFSLRGSSESQYADAEDEDSDEIEDETEVAEADEETAPLTMESEEEEPSEGDVVAGEEPESQSELGGILHRTDGATPVQEDEVSNSAQSSRENDEEPPNDQHESADSVKDFHQGN